MPARPSLLRVTVYTLLFSAVIVVVAALLGRAARNLQAALVSKPDIAIYLLLPEEDMGQVTVLRASDTQREYLAQTKEGPKLVILKKGEQQWYVGSIEKLHE